MNRSLSIVSAVAFSAISFVAFYALADDSVIAPQDFFAQILEAIKTFGGLSTMLKISAVITLIISSMKVSFFNQLIWSKLGSFKVWLAPALGLLAGILGLGHDGPITGAMIFAYISAGAGAIIFHELLDSLKSIPGIGSNFLMIINFIQALLGGPKKQ